MAIRSGVERPGRCRRAQETGRGPAIRQGAEGGASRMMGGDNARGATDEG